MTRSKHEFFQVAPGSTFQDAMTQAKLALAEAADGTKFSRKTPNNPYNLSFIKLQGKVYALSRSNEPGKPHYLGRGNYGKVKYIMDEESQIYVVKIETTNDPFQQMETRVGQALGLVKGDKQKQDDKEKYYTVMLDLGVNLTSYLSQNPNLAPARRLDLAIQACLQLYDMHQHFVHRDIKPDNIVIDEHGLVHLIDFGLAEALDDKGELKSVEGFLTEGMVLNAESRRVYNQLWTIGTPGFWPGTPREISIYHTKHDNILPSRMQKLGHIGCDNAALKRILVNEHTGGGLFTRQFMATLPEALFNLIRKNNVIFDENPEKETHDETKKMAALFIFIHRQLIQCFNDHQIEEKNQNFQAYKRYRASGELLDDKEVEEILASPSRQEGLIDEYRGHLAVRSGHSEEAGPSTQTSVYSSGYFP
ncbi:protein kinase domain-containing protein [Legionella erythra]|nr:protein kinase [Legionella erythra]